MICKKCQKKIQDGTSVCPFCGAPQGETVSLGAMSSAPAAKNKKSRKKAGAISTTAIVALIMVPVLLISMAGIGACCLLKQTPPGTEDIAPINPDNLGINEELVPQTEDVINIALFGLDNRGDDDDGRSDAIIILSVDKKHNKIKLISVARDTLVNVEDYGWNDNSRDDDWTKLTHAFYFGANNKGKIEENGGKNAGPAVAMKTLNENFGLNISRYGFVNFHEFAEIIDYLGGVEIEVKDYELAQLNKHIRGMVNKSGMDIEEISAPGLQTLSGGQALAYARLRKVDTDIKRGNRQKAVLEAAFKKMKNQPLTKYPGLITKLLEMCNTNMTYGECLDLATWAVTKSPELVNYSLPDDDGKLYSWDSYSNKSGSTFKTYGSVYVMNLDYVTAYLQDIIYEEEPKKALPENAEIWYGPQFPQHMLNKETDETTTP